MASARTLLASQSDGNKDVWNGWLWREGRLARDDSSRWGKDWDLCANVAVGSVEDALLQFPFPSGKWSIEIPKTIPESAAHTR